MRLKRIAVLIVGIFAFSVGSVWAGEAAPQKVIDLANSVLVKYGEDPAIIKGVKAENDKGKTLDQIKALDEKWKKHAGTADYMEALMTSETGKYLKSIQGSKPYFSEIFVMDNQGANVAMTNKTSDYWQGDEAKFKESFKGGQGAVHISEVEFDDSSQAYLVQVSVPVKEGGKAIGAITFGIDVDKI